MAAGAKSSRRRRLTASGSASTGPTARRRSAAEINSLAILLCIHFLSTHAHCGKCKIYLCHGLTLGSLATLYAQKNARARTGAANTRE